MTKTSDRITAPPSATTAAAQLETPVVRLPPGQRRTKGFPRFGTHLAHPPPPVPEAPTIRIGGEVPKAVEVAVAILATLPRREQQGDFHCVAGWSATDLCWQGVGFATFYRRIIEPLLAPDTTVTHLVFRGLDGYQSIVTIDDALGGDVLIADRLDERPLDGDHGAPARLVSPSQYGYVSTKHLCSIAIHTAEPVDPDASSITTLLFRRHRRARVWLEERHRVLPAWVLRPLYRALAAPLLILCARGSAPGPSPLPRPQDPAER